MDHTKGKQLEQERKGLALFSTCVSPVLISSLNCFTTCSFHILIQEFMPIIDDTSVLIPTLLSIVINKSLKKQCGHRDQQKKSTRFDTYPITDITVLIYIDCLSLYTIIFQVRIELIFRYYLPRWS